MTKKYVRVSCTVCLRTADRIYDPSRVVPDRCTITLRCQGRLFPVDYVSNAQITSLPAPGVEDWYPRNRSFAQGSSTQDVELINTASGSLAQVVLALRLTAAPPDSSLAMLTLKSRQDVPKAFKQFTYNREVSFTSISGADDTSSKKVLRYSTSGTDADIIEVYVNGVKLQQGTLPGEYQVFSGSGSSAAPNSILFNSPVEVAATTQVDVIVSKQQVADTFKLGFIRNIDDDSRNLQEGWNNISHIDRIDETGTNARYYLFTLDLADQQLPVNLILSPVGNVFVYPTANDSVLPPPVAPIEVVPQTAALMLFCRAPYTKVDRYLSTVAQLSDLDENRDYLKLAPSNDDQLLLITKSSLKTIFPPMVPATFNQEKTIQTVSEGQSEQLVVDGSVIVGPDV